MTSSVVRVMLLRLSFSVMVHAGVGLSHFLKILWKNSLNVVALALGSVISMLLDIRWPGVDLFFVRRTWVWL